MRHTTKIFIGSSIILSIFVIICVFYLWQLEKENDKIDSSLDPELEYIDIPKAKIVYIDSLDRIEGNRRFLRGTIKLHNEDNNKNQLHINKQLASLTNTKLSGDTLFISFDSKIILEIFSQTKLNSFIIDGTIISLPIDSTLKIVSHMNWLGTRIENVRMKELDISITKASFLLTDSKIDILTTRTMKGYKKSRNDMGYYSNNNRIGTYNLNLDYVRDPEIEDCIINELNYMGGDADYYKIPYINSKRTNWYPKFEKQKLSITMSDTTLLGRYQQ